MELTLIISYYKALDKLKLILKALNQQSTRNFEVIISEDDNNFETIDFILKCKDMYAFKITHIYQPKDDGFRKNEMLNKAIINSNTDKLVFIDGDCIPHKYFIINYINSFKEGFILDGRAVMLDEKTTHYVLETLSLKRLNLFYLLFTNSSLLKNGIYSPFISLSFKKSGRGLVGRNWGIYKKHLIDVNGFDMDYVHAGVGEDVDIEWRLKAIGIKTILMKNKSIVYHLFHKRGSYDKMFKHNYELLNNKKKLNNVYCLNGIDKIIVK